jgi:hypothetical protein
MRFAIFAGVVVVGLTVPAAARAAGGGFGGSGQLVITDDQPIGAVALVGLQPLGLAPVSPTSTSTASFQFGSVSDNGGSGTAFALAPAIDYFVIDSLSLGIDGLIGVLNPAHGNRGPGTTITLFGIAPRVGYNIRITDGISWWPKVFFEYVTFSSSNNNGGGNASAIGLFAPFMFEPARHFLLGIGPNVSTQLGNNSTQGGMSTPNPKVTLFGVQATIGGWCLGD